MTLGRRIQQLRKEKGMSQEQLGETLGVTRQAVSRWEMDGAVPEVDKLIAMSQLFGVDLNELLQVERTAAPPTAQDRAVPQSAGYRRAAVIAIVLCALLFLSNFLLWFQVIQLKKQLRPWEQLREYAQEQLDQPELEEIHPQLLELSCTGPEVERKREGAASIRLAVSFRLPEEQDREGLLVRLDAAPPAPGGFQVMERGEDGLYRGEITLRWDSVAPLETDIAAVFTGKGIEPAEVGLYRLVYYPNTGLCSVTDLAF